MPGKLKVRVIEGRNLPVMDRSSDNTDAYVEVKLGNVTQKTEVYKQSLNPEWKSEFIFEVNDLDLQDEPLQIRIMDHDKYSANDAIGKVYVDLNPLLLSTSQQPSYDHREGVAGIPTISGWLPVYDTMHGINGEVNIVVEVDLFSDFNKFRQSSCGIQFFFCSGVPANYRCENILGFIEELVVNDDPEYQWLSKIRPHRASNEARQALFFKLSGELQRRIGRKVLELGGNAVIGYRQSFDVEVDYGIVVRGLGSAVTLVHAPRPHYLGDPTYQPESFRDVHTTNASCSASKSPQQYDNGMSPHHKVSSPHHGSVAINRRSSDSDISLTPKGGSFTGSVGSSGGKAQYGYTDNLSPLVNCSFEMMEFPFLSMKSYPPGFILSVVGTVSAKAVKLLDRIKALEEVETRDSWWNQVRTEIKSHAKALSCNVILGYEEYTTMCDDVCVLGASGTAAIINTQYQESPNVFSFKNIKETVGSADKMDFPTRYKEKTALKETQSNSVPKNASNLEDLGDSGKGRSTGPSDYTPAPPCQMCHVPYSMSSLPFEVTLSKCAVCRKGRVPDVIFTTLEIPTNFPITGRGCLIQSRAARMRKDLKGEANAKEISNALPFLEYEIYRQLYNKVKIKGMNMLFGLRVRVTIGRKFMVGIATGTAAFASALAPMPEPKLMVTDETVEDATRRMEAQKKISETVQKNREFYGLKTEGLETINNDSDPEDVEDEPLEADLNCGQKDSFILKIDDISDMEMIKHLVKCRPHNDILVVSTEEVPGVSKEDAGRDIQMFTKVWRTKIPGTLNNAILNSYLERLMESLYFKIRKLNPSNISGLRFNVELPDEDELQISVLGIINSHSENCLPSRPTVTNGINKEKKKQEESDLMFRMEEMGLDDVTKTNVAVSPSVPSASSFCSTVSSTSSGKLFSRKTHEASKVPLRIGEPFGVKITPLSSVPFYRIDRYLGNLNFFLIRESNSIKECGGLNGFMGCFVSEVLALVRSHVAAAGGNALTSFFLSECLLYQHKNQGQCLINVGGDIVKISPFNDVPTQIEEESCA